MHSDSRETEGKERIENGCEQRYGGGKRHPAQDSSLSRRQFLQFAGLGSAAFALAGAGATALTGCATEDSKATAGTTAQSDGGFEYESFETDVLIIGAGNAASAAAWSALKESMNVMMVDKGPMLASGASGTNWGGFSNAFSVDPDTPLSEHRFDWLGNPIGTYLVNTPLWRNALNQYKEGARDNDMIDRGATLINHGNYLPYRNADGSIEVFGSNMTLSIYPRHELDTLLSQSLVDICNWTMITDLIIENGVCAGAIGLYLPTGTIRVFRAKATILATPAATTMFGFTGVRQFSVGAYDNTSDTDAALYRHGVGLAENEYAQFDAKAVEPYVFACGWGSLTCDAQTADLLVDSNGNKVFDDPAKANDRNYFCEVLGKKRLEGGVYIDLSSWDGAANPAEFSADTLALDKKFGVDPLSTPLEAAPDMYEKGGAPVVDENLMTEVSGLFCTRGAGTNGDNGGSCLFNNHIFGNYVGYTATTYAKKLDAVPEFDWSLVSDEYQRLADIRNNTASSDAIRPITVRHSIQKASYDALGPYRPVDKIEEAITELERIRDEDLPNQVVEDSSSTFNKDWQGAIENYNLLCIALMSVKATYEREESRGSYIRDDFPDKDDENWKCLLVCRESNGEMSFEKQALPEVVE